MPSTPDWKKRAENQYNNERENLNDEIKSRFYLYLLIFGVFGVIFGAFYVVRWMIVGGDFLPSHHESLWTIIVIAGYVPFTYVMERFDRKREIREQRLIRIEMKIDALLDKQDDVESQLRNIKGAVRDTYSR